MLFSENIWDDLIATCLENSDRTQFNKIKKCLKRIKKKEVISNGIKVINIYFLSDIKKFPKINDTFRSYTYMYICVCVGGGYKWVCVCVWVCVI